jgi:hypothetical protein
MSTDRRIDVLRRLQQRVDKIREELGISAPGTTVFRADLGPLGENVVIVEADGFGGAATMVIEGNYPVDFSVKSESAFPTEDEAIAAADRIIDGEASFSSILGDFC